MSGIILPRAAEPTATLKRFSGKPCFARIVHRYFNAQTFERFTIRRVNACAVSGRCDGSKKIEEIFGCSEMPCIPDISLRSKPARHHHSLFFRPPCSWAKKSLGKRKDYASPHATTIK